MHRVQLQPLDTGQFHALQTMNATVVALHGLNLESHAQLNHGVHSIIVTPIIPLAKVDSKGVSII